MSTDPKNESSLRAGIPAGIAGLVAAVPFAALNAWIGGSLGKFFGFLGLLAFLLVGFLVFAVISEGAVLYCPQCRKRVKIGATRCHHCGERVA
jgi:high-affinity Fe2+/Pb2+ permease